MPLTDFLHYNIATQGVRAGHEIFVNFGFGSTTVEVVVTPPSQWGYYPDQTDYKLTIIVKRKDKMWSQDYYVSPLHFKSLEKVVASLKKITKVKDVINVVVKSIDINIKKIFVKIKGL